MNYSNYLNNPKYLSNMENTNLYDSDYNPYYPPTEAAKKTDDLIFFEDVRTRDYDFFLKYEDYLRHRNYTDASILNNSIPSLFTYTCGLWNLIKTRIKRLQEYVRNVLTEIESSRARFDEVVDDGRAAYGSKPNEIPLWGMENAVIEGGIMPDISSAAFIKVTYPQNAVCTCSLGGTTLSAVASPCIFVVTTPGAWRVACTDGTNTRGKTVKVTPNGSKYEISMDFSAYGSFSAFIKIISEFPETKNTYAVITGGSVPISVLIPESGIVTVQVFENAHYRVQIMVDGEPRTNDKRVTVNASNPTYTIRFPLDYTSIVVTTEEENLKGKLVTITTIPNDSYVDEEEEEELTDENDIDNNEEIDANESVDIDQSNDIDADEAEEESSIVMTAYFNNESPATASFRILPGYKWEITSSDGTDTLRNVCNASTAGQIYYVELKSLASIEIGETDFNLATEEDIVKMLEAHYAGFVNIADYWHVGDERVIHLAEMNNPNTDPVGDKFPEQNISIVITAVDDGTKDSLTPKLTSPEGNKTRAAIVVQTKQCLNDKGLNNLHDSAYINGDSEFDDTFTAWRDINLQTWLNDVFLYQGLSASELQNFVKQTYHKRIDNFTYGGTEEISESIFLPSYTEIFGNVLSNDYLNVNDIQYLNYNEGHQWEYFLNEENRIKHVNSDIETGLSEGNVIAWWQSSPSSFFNTTNPYIGYYWLSVNTQGKSEKIPGNVTKAIAPAFAL